MSFEIISETKTIKKILFFSSIHDYLKLSKFNLLHNHWRIEKYINPKLSSTLSHPSPTSSSFSLSSISHNTNNNNTHKSHHTKSPYEWVVKKICNESIGEDDLTLNNNGRCLVYFSRIHTKDINSIFDPRWTIFEPLAEVNTQINTKYYKNECFYREP